MLPTDLDTMERETPMLTQLSFMELMPVTQLLMAMLPPLFLLVQALVSIHSPRVLMLPPRVMLLMLTVMVLVTTASVMLMPIQLFCMEVMLVMVMLETLMPMDLLIPAMLDFVLTILVPRFLARYYFDESGTLVLLS